MRFLALFLALFSPLHALVLEDVRVTVTADSALKAREQALDQAYLKAFEQVNEQNSGLSLSPHQLQGLVRSVRVNREKVTGNTYMASYAFDFDEAGLGRLQQAPPPSSSPDFPLMAPGAPPATPILLTVHYKDLKEWSALENLLRINTSTLTLISLSSSEAKLTLVPQMDEGTFQQKLQSAGWHKTPQGQEWLLSRL